MPWVVQQCRERHFLKLVEQFWNKEFPHRHLLRTSVTTTPRLIGWESSVVGGTGAATKWIKIKRYTKNDNNGRLDKILTLAWKDTFQRKLGENCSILERDRPWLCILEHRWVHQVSPNFWRKKINQLIYLMIALYILSQLDVLSTGTSAFIIIYFQRRQKYSAVMY